MPIHETPPDPTPAGIGAVSAQNSSGTPLEGVVMEVGDVSPPAAGAGGYPTGGFTVDLSARFADLHFVKLELETAGSLPHCRWEISRLTGPNAGKFKVKLTRHRYDRPGAVGAVGGQPAGVTVQSASGAATAGEAGHTHAVGSLANAAEAAHTHAVGTLANAAEAAHTHGSGTFANAGHTHGSGTFGNSSEATHTHGVGTIAAGAHTHGSGSFGITGTTGVESADAQPLGAGSGTAPAVNHTHAAGSLGLSGATGSTTPSMSGTSAAGAGHTHTLTGASGSTADTLSGSSGAGASHNHAISGASAAGASHNHAISGSSAAGSSHTHADNNIYDHAHAQTLTETDAAKIEVANAADLSTTIFRYLAIGTAA